MGQRLNLPGQFDGIPLVRKFVMSVALDVFSGLSVMRRCWGLWQQIAVPVVPSVALNRGTG